MTKAKKRRNASFKQYVRTVPSEQLLLYSSTLSSTQTQQPLASFCAAQDIQNGFDYLDWHDRFVQRSREFAPANAPPGEQSSLQYFF
jgi:hypothetical protein